MAVNTKFTPSTLAMALKPGVNSLIGAELDKLVDEHVKQFKEELVSRIKHKTELMIQECLWDSRTNVSVNCTVEVKPE